MHDFTARQLLVSAIREWVDRGEPTNDAGVPLVDELHIPIATALRVERRNTVEHIIKHYATGSGVVEVYSRDLRFDMLGVAHQQKGHDG